MDDLRLRWSAPYILIGCHASPSAVTVRDGGSGNWRLSWRMLHWRSTARDTSLPAGVVVLHWSGLSEERGRRGLLGG